MHRWILWLEVNGTKEKINSCLFSMNPQYSRVSPFIKQIKACLLPIDMGIFRLYANVEVNENHLLSIPVRP